MRTSVKWWVLVNVHLWCSMFSAHFWPTYLPCPTFQRPILGTIFDPPIPTLISDFISEHSLLIKYFLQQDQFDAKVSNNTQLIHRIIKCTGPLDECACLKLGGTYTFILGKCYYVEINLYNYADAMMICQNQIDFSHLSL